ncbi:glycine cleavage system aminomethyltransferase GcvT [Desulfohalobiaceae bacterium Ax17]|jgi:aminomethyltransferase|uniref:glycine cleavage system aminomethyltransferase GcvT n=1 Tax=Desulfovulcanus ferrireducens TaxID=2831190 RepID=UPI00207BBFA2|nr:glycine cleavage system aminomethyltransferase GcvT [Desulfovulcanus ferrireducens]MBT8763411.1 glycine cleavage system aminomethyltransferase GcvT [Desulfovulcanus ferrireducens]
MNDLLTTPLNQWHKDNKAKMVPFAGWEMPVQYSGIMAEHKHTRAAASIFDISHMGEFIISGDQAEQALSNILTHNLKTLTPGKCRYGFMLNESGGVLDDLIVYRLEEHKFMLVVNGACIDSDFEWIKTHLPQNVTITNVSLELAKIDLQGPKSIEVLEETIPGQWRTLGYFNFRQINFNGYDLIISRTGYTGELGYEFYLPWNKAESLWTMLLENKLVEPAGLGARDTLRLEAGLPLYGQDLDQHHTPVEAGYGFMLKSEANYIGRDKVNDVREKLIPLKIPGRRSARHGDQVFYAGEKVGQVTSGSFAPSLGFCIALAYVDKEFADKNEYIIKGSRTELKAEKAELPFYKQGTARIKL